MSPCQYSAIVHESFYHEFLILKFWCKELTPEVFFLLCSELDEVRLKERGRLFRDSFLAKVWRLAIFYVDLVNGCFLIKQYLKSLVEKTILCLQVLLCLLSCPFL